MFLWTFQLSILFQKVIVLLKVNARWSHTCPKCGVDGADFIPHLVLWNSKCLMNILSIGRYQLELCKKAMEENIIVYLGTGCGKTHISVLLMHELGHLIRKPQKNICVFLAPTVALVHQVSCYSYSIWYIYQINWIVLVLIFHQILVLLCWSILHYVFSKVYFLFINSKQRL